MEDELKTTYAEKVELDITKIEVEMNKFEKDKIARIKLMTSKGPITWKPKTTKVEDYMGVEVKSEDSMGIEEFVKHSKTSELTREIKKNGFVSVRMSYTIGTTEVDGEENTYRWIRFISQWDAIEQVKGVEETKIE